MTTSIITSSGTYVSAFFIFSIILLDINGKRSYTNRVGKVILFILYNKERAEMEKHPEGKYLATVKIGPKGQIVVPKEVRDMFELTTGDSLILMADKGQGIALQPFAYAEAFWNAVKSAKGEEE